MSWQKVFKQLKQFKMERHSPEKIVEILHSIKELSVKDGELDVLFVDSTAGWESITGFVPESFTRQLLKLIENHLLGDSIREDSESIIDTLKSLSSFNLENNNLTADFYYFESQSPRAFIASSFTRELLEFIESYLNGDNQFRLL